jgi:hypothetical protein
MNSFLKNKTLSDYSDKIKIDAINLNLTNSRHNSEQLIPKKVKKSFKNFNLNKNMPAKPKLNIEIQNNEILSNQNDSLLNFLQLKLHEINKNDDPNLTEFENKLLRLKTFDAKEKQLKREMKERGARNLYQELTL